MVNRNVDVAGALIKVGADVNIADHTGDSPLMLSVIQGDHQMMDLMLPGASLMNCNNNGHNILHVAAVKVIVLILIQNYRSAINVGGEASLTNQR